MSTYASILDRSTNFFCKTVLWYKRFCILTSSYSVYSESFTNIQTYKDELAKNTFSLKAYSTIE